MQQTKLRKYIDESGTAGPMNPADAESRYLALVGVSIPQDERHAAFKDRFEELKKTHLPLPSWADCDTPPCVLHREDIVRRTAPYFVALRVEEKRKAFDAALLRAIEETPFVLVGVVLDKKKHQQADYRRVKDDYHYCMEALLERYCGRMLKRKCVGDVMAESRGGSQDRALKEVFRNLAEKGGRYFKSELQGRLTSKEIKLKPKVANVMGLQLADLLARDVKREILASRGLCEKPQGFAAELAAVLSGKYNRRPSDGRIAGYGQVWLE